MSVKGLIQTCRVQQKVAAQCRGWVSPSTLWSPCLESTHWRKVKHMHTLEKSQKNAHTGEKSKECTHWRKVKENANSGALASMTLLAPFNVLPHCQVHLVGLPVLRVSFRFSYYLYSKLFGANVKTWRSKASSSSPRAVLQQLPESGMAQNHSSHRCTWGILLSHADVESHERTP